LNYGGAIKKSFSCFALFPLLDNKKLYNLARDDTEDLLVFQRVLYQKCLISRLK